MRILILSTAITSHTIKWARSLSEKDEVVLFSMPAANPEINSAFPNLSIRSINVDPLTSTSEGFSGKFSYIRSLGVVKKIIREFKPDILHAHWATSYGLIGSLSGFHPFVLSVWGADIFEFPRKSFIHRAIVKFNLRNADVILSTSNMMVKEIKKYTDKQVDVTPFGINVELFKKIKVDSLFNTECTVIGTIKTLEEKYGIEYLLRAFALVRNKLTGMKIKLLVIGGGSLENSLKQLALDLKIYDDTIFTGRVNYDQIISYHNMLDIYVAVSVQESESFGVAVLESSSCEKPVIVSDIGGLPEVVENGVTGIIVPPRDIESLASALEKLLKDENLRQTMGKNGRQRVIDKYNWNGNVNQMRSIYERILK